MSSGQGAELQAQQVQRPLSAGMEQQQQVQQQGPVFSASGNTDEPQVVGMPPEIDPEVAIVLEEHQEHDILYPEDFETDDEYFAYLEEHPEALLLEPAAGVPTTGAAHIEIGFTGIKIAGEVGFIVLVILALPVLYYIKRRMDLHFAKKKAVTEQELGVELD
jgi:hypothetical protein